ncbi:hypothetical protein VCHA53O466_50345 [Vibrio chagasii]|nr:hypothetical protein VCHA53O466_50345 [Vibrio chagasii]
MTEKSTKQNKSEAGETILGLVLLVSLIAAITTGLNGSFPSYESLFKPTHTLTQETQFPSIFSSDVITTRDGVTSRQEINYRCTLAEGTTIQFAFHSGIVESYGPDIAVYGYQFNQHGKTAQAEMPCKFDNFISEVQSVKARKLFSGIERERSALNKANKILSISED